MYCSRFPFRSVSVHFYTHESQSPLLLEVPMGRVLSSFIAMDNSDKHYFTRPDGVLRSIFWLKDLNFSLVNLFIQISILTEPG